MDAVRFTHEIEDMDSINAAHNLAFVDLTKKYVAAKTIVPGTLLKDSSGDKTPWIQGTDNANLITGIYAGATETTTSATNAYHLTRVFGPVRKSKLVAWTAADGSTTAAPNAAALAQLESMKIYAL